MGALSATTAALDGLKRRLASALRRKSSSVRTALGRARMTFHRRLRGHKVVRTVRSDGDLVVTFHRAWYCVECRRHWWL